MSKFKITNEHLKQIMNECHKKGNPTNLNTLKAILGQYYNHYPNPNEYQLILSLDKKIMRQKILEVLCNNLSNLQIIINPKIGDDYNKKLKREDKEDKEGKKKKEKEIKKEEIKKEERRNRKDETKEKDYDIVKKNSSDILKSDKIDIKITKADKNYLNNLKKKIIELENNEYNIKKFEEDINDDKFIENAIIAHRQALEYKLHLYNKLSKINWNGEEKKKEKNFDFNAPKAFSIDLNKIINNMITIIKDKLLYLNSNVKIKEQKKEDLLNILYNKDNGIYALKGKSRENIRISLLKKIYMFFKVPNFFFKGFNNYMITGSAGSGKTKLGAIIAHMMNNLGILATDNLIVATRQNLVGEFIGQSGTKTRSLLANALEGVIFIDEAYTLTPCDKTNKDNFSEEAIGELINFIDKFIGCLVVIVAGYKDKMHDCFLTFNEGISRRFPNVIDLIPYTSSDLYKVFEIFLKDSIDIKKIFTKEQREFIKSIISALNDNDIFNNQAGDMLNLSKIIGEDAILKGENYNNNMIKFSFMKFCASKNIAIEF